MNKVELSLVIAGMSAGWGDLFDQQTMLEKSAISYYLADQYFKELVDDIYNCLN